MPAYASGTRLIVPTPNKSPQMDTSRQSLESRTPEELCCEFFSQTGEIWGSRIPGATG